MESTWKVAADRPKDAIRRNLQTPNQKNNPKHKKPRLKVATFHQPKVATKKFSKQKQKNHNPKTAKPNQKPNQQHPTFFRYFQPSSA
jgi:hypothetical protein